MTTLMLPAADAAAARFDQLSPVVAAFLGRCWGVTRQHTASDLRCFLAWCAENNLDPLAARRPHLELYLRWMQEARAFKPSTVSRRFSVVAGCYRTAVIDGVLESSPAEHVRRPVVPPESPTLGLTHLQFEALLTASRESANLNDFALVVMLGLLGLRIFEATGADIADLEEEHGVLRVVGKGGKVVGLPEIRAHPWPGGRPSEPGQRLAKRGLRACRPLRPHVLPLRLVRSGTLGLGHPRRRPARPSRRSV